MSAAANLAPYGPWTVIDTLADPKWKEKVDLRGSRRKWNRFLVVTPTNVSSLGFKPIIVADFEYLPWAWACASSPQMLAALSAIAERKAYTRPNPGPPNGWRLINLPVDEVDAVHAAISAATGAA